MAYKYPLTDSIGRDYPNFLSSAVGLTLKTYQYNNADFNADQTTGKKLVKAGTVISKTTGEGSSAVTTYYGIAYKDIDVTAGDLEGSIMIAGRVYSNRLPATLTSAQKQGLEALGFHFDVAPDVTRV